MGSGGMLTQRWARWMRAGGMSERTVHERVQMVQRFEAAIGCDSLTATWEDIADFLGNPTFGVSTRQTYHSNMRVWFRWLVRMHHRVDDPTLQLPTPKNPRRRPRPISLGQLGRILSTTHRHRTHAMVLLAAYQGLRVHEIAKFRGEHLVEGDLYVAGKGGREDWIPVHDLVAEVASSMPTRGWWFQSHTRPDRPINSGSVSATISDLMHRAGVNATPHALRHFYGTELLRTRGNLAVVRQLMRHENLATTALYTDVDATERRDTIAALPVPLRVVTRRT